MELSLFLGSIFAFLVIVFVAYSRWRQHNKDKARLLERGVRDEADKGKAKLKDAWDKWD